MVARHFGVVEAVGSNPATQTKKDQSERSLDWPFLLLKAGTDPTVKTTTKLCETQSTLGSGVSEQKQSKRLFV